MKNANNPFKGKRFLLTHWALAVLGGSENNILQMAEYIRDQGGLVEFFTYAFDNPVKEIIQEKNFQVKVDDINLLDQSQATHVKYDLNKIDYIIVCQNVIPIDIIKQLNVKSLRTKFVFFHMSAFIGLAMESPLFYDLEAKIASKILTISEETTVEQIERLLGENIRKLTYYRNPVPDNFINDIQEISYPKVPRRVAVISNHPPRELIDLERERVIVDCGVKIEYIAVSYTHLTLPTIYSV